MVGWRMSLIQLACFKLSTEYSCTGFVQQFDTALYLSTLQTLVPFPITPTTTTTANIVTAVVHA